MDKLWNYNTDPLENVEARNGKAKAAFTVISFFLLEAEHGCQEESGNAIVKIVLLSTS